MPDSALPKHLQGKLHWDWWGPFGRIPRGWTAWKWGAPSLVKGRLNEFVHVGPAKFAPKPIDPPGGWQVSRFQAGPWFAWYFAFTLKNGRHFRIGARWDDVDGYVQWPAIASRHLPPSRVDTSTGHR